MQEQESVNFFAERENGADCHFEVLCTPRDTHYSHAADKPADQMDYGNLPPSQQNPDEVHHRRQAARLAWAVNQFMAERPQGVGAQLEKLYSEWYAHDGNAHHKAYYIVNQSDYKTSQNQPENVA